MEVGSNGIKGGLISETRSARTPFLELYLRGEVSAAQIGDFIEAWHNQDASNEYALSEFLGMMEDEYTVWMASRKALPAIVAARLQKRPLQEPVAEDLDELRSAGLPSDRSAIHILTHWLERRL